MAGVVEAAYEFKEMAPFDGCETPEDFFENWFLENAPISKADWSVSVLTGDDATLPPANTIYYVLYCLSPEPWSYDSPEETWEDPAELARFGKYLVDKRMK